MSLRQDVAAAAAKGGKGLGPASAPLAAAAKDAPIDCRCAGAAEVLWLALAQVRASATAIKGCGRRYFRWRYWWCRVGNYWRWRVHRGADTRAMGSCWRLRNRRCDVGQVRNQIQRNIEADKAVGLSETQEMLVDYAPLNGRGASLLQALVRLSVALG